MKQCMARAIKGDFINNMTKGRMISIINTKSGEILYPAIDKINRVYERHLLTNTKIQGFINPYWDEVIKMIEKAGPKCQKLDI